jgi:hypothetical protein
MRVALIFSKVTCGSQPNVVVILERGHYIIRFKMLRLCRKGCIQSIRMERLCATMNKYTQVTK